MSTDRPTSARQQAEWVAQLRGRPVSELKAQTEGASLAFGHLSELLDLCAMSTVERFDPKFGALMQAAREAITAARSHLGTALEQKPVVLKRHAAPGDRQAPRNFRRGQAAAFRG